LDELDQFLEQSNISEKNVRRLEALARIADDRVRERAAAILEVARLYPRKRRRYVRLVRENPQLLQRLKIVLGDAWWDDLAVSGALGNAADHWEPNGADAPPPVQPSLPPTRNDLKQITIHTDGACQNNPGPGGWAAVLRYGKHVKELKGAEPATTNNRMELQAALAALGALKQPCAVEIFTDSKYLRDGISQWLARWKINGWQTLERTPVKNQDLWLQLDTQCARHRITWRWLKAHAGHPDNERCDQLARAEIVRLQTAGS
jgi:ribonuclease HI